MLEMSIPVVFDALERDQRQLKSWKMFLSVYVLLFEYHAAIKSKAFPYIRRRDVQDQIIQTIQNLCTNILHCALL
jgi:hypothetical protein